jgi:class 3 adenylate cyclase
VNDRKIDYARADDGCHLAYRVTGDGPIDLIEIGGYGTLFPIDAVDDQPRWRRFEERLGRFCRLIRFDIRGIGLSDRGSGDLTVRRWVADALAVLDTVGSERATALGTSYGGLAVIQLAADHPDRIDRTILANTAAKFIRSDDYPEGVDPETAAVRTDAADPATPNRGDSMSEIELMAPSIANDAEAQRWWIRSAQRGAGPAVAKEVWDLAVNADVRDAVERIEAPSLVIRTLENAFMPPALPGWVAAHLSNGQLCDLPGRDQVIWAIPDDAVSDRIEEFLTGARSPSTGSTSIQAVLFTDIVDSTASNASSGDRAWIELLARHDALADRTIRQHGGRLVKRLGDGLLAVFELASDALDAAAQIAGSGESLGVGIRTGVHAAEVEHVDGDILGLGVNVAARVMSHANAGEVLTTQAVVELLAGTDHRFDNRGAHHLKGVEGDWDLHALEIA